MADKSTPLASALHRALGATPLSVDRRELAVFPFDALARLPGARIQEFGPGGRRIGDGKGRAALRMQRVTVPDGRTAVRTALVVGGD
jgi:hypothetical protein